MALEGFINRLNVIMQNVDRASLVILDKLADTLVEELDQRVPDQSKNPLNTGNLKRALTTRSDATQIGPHAWHVGIGPYTLLGTPGEKRYEPEPIKRFLADYRGEKEAEKKRAEDIADRKRKQREERAEAKKQGRLKDAGVEMTEEEYHRHQVAAANEAIAKLVRAKYDLLKAIDKLTVDLNEKRVELDKRVARGYDVDAKSQVHLNLLAAIEVMRKRLDEMYKRKDVLDRRIAIIREARLLYIDRYRVR